MTDFQEVSRFATWNAPFEPHAHKDPQEVSVVIVTISPLSELMNVRTT